MAFGVSDRMLEKMAKSRILKPDIALLGVSDRMLEKMAKSRILKPDIALLYFASKGDIVEARVALRLGADKDTTDYDGNTPLQRCVCSSSEGWADDEVALESWSR